MSIAFKSIKEKQLPAHSISIEKVASRGFPATARLASCSSRCDSFHIKRWPYVNWSVL